MACITCLRMPGGWGPTSGAQPGRATGCCHRPHGDRCRLPRAQRLRQQAALPQWPRTASAPVRTTGGALVLAPDRRSGRDECNPVVEPSCAAAVGRDDSVRLGDERFFHEPPGAFGGLLVVRSGAGEEGRVLNARMDTYPTPGSKGRWPLSAGVGSEPPATKPWDRCRGPGPEPAATARPACRGARRTPR